MAFSSPAFTVIEEDEVGSICITIEDKIERNVTVTLSSNEQCEFNCLSLIHHVHYLSSVPADDFLDISVNLTFTSGEIGQEVCHSFSVNDDTILEDTEVYETTLTSLNEDVVIRSPTTSLVILDEIDGICIILALHNVVFVLLQIM